MAINWDKPAKERDCPLCGTETEMKEKALVRPPRPGSGCVQTTTAYGASRPAAVGRHRGTPNRAGGPVAKSPKGWGNGIMADWYPEQELERHGLTPDTWGSAAVYALALDTPDGIDAFADRWYRVVDAPPTADLSEAIGAGRELRYVGAASNLRERLQDHVDRDRRRVKLLAVCPPTAVVAVWTYDGFEDAEAHERRRAYELRDANPRTAVYTDGEIV